MKSILSDISVDFPFGKDLKYDDSFLWIEQEIDKVYSVSAEESTNWNSVKNNCNEFLSHKSKDLKIAVWWVFSNWRLENYVGLESALVIFNELLEKYNKSIFPSSEKAKKNTIVWLEEILTREIVEQKSFLNKLLNSLEIIEHLQNTQKNLFELLDTEDKYFTKIIRFIKTIHEQNIQNSQVEVVKKVEKENSTKKEIKNSPKVTQEKITSISNKDDAIKVMNDFKKTAAMLSEYYREENIFDMKWIKIVRFLSWINIDSLPLDEKGITKQNLYENIQLNIIKVI